MKRGAACKGSRGVVRCRPPERVVERGPVLVTYTLAAALTSANPRSDTEICLFCNIDYLKRDTGGGRVGQKGAQKVGIPFPNVMLEQHESPMFLSVKPLFLCPFLYFSFGK